MSIPMSDGQRCQSCNTILERTVPRIKIITSRMTSLPEKSGGGTLSG